MYLGLQIAIYEIQNKILIRFQKKRVRFCFETRSQSSSNWPDTCFVDQSASELLEILHLSLPLHC